MRSGTVCELLASTVQAMHNCIASDNHEWRDKHEATIRQLVDDFMPSGSGWDNGTTLDMAKSNCNRLVFTGAYHHMDEAGGYAGWTEHEITVTPAFGGFHVKVGGRNRNDIKDYLSDLFLGCLSSVVAWDDASKRYSDQPNVCDPATEIEAAMEWHKRRDSK